MTTELRDLRAKILAEDDEILTELSLLSGLDKSQLVREWIHERAQGELVRAERIASRLRAFKGRTGSGEA